MSRTETGTAELRRNADAIDWRPVWLTHVMIDSGRLEPKADIVWQLANANSGHCAIKLTREDSVRDPDDRYPRVQYVPVLFLAGAPAYQRQMRRP